MTSKMNPSLKAWFVVSLAVMMFGCGNCQRPCRQSIPYPQAGSCPLPGVARGQPGGPCPDWPDQCASQSECNSGTCLPCGSSGQTCCGPMDHCYVGTCDQNGDICRSDCGGLNEQCCSDAHCVDGAVCDRNSNTCKGGPPACNGNTTWYIGLINNTTKCAVPENIIVRANSASEAATCAASMPSYGYNLLPPQTSPNVPNEYTGCVKSSNIFYGSSNAYFYAYSSADAAACLQSYCTNCEVSMGECPEETE